MNKTCRTCKIEKTISGNFTRHSKGSLRLDCNACRSRAWTESNKNPAKKEHRKKISKNSRLKKTYGISTERYNELFSLTKGCCYICGLHQSTFNKALAVDHCHETGKVRGLLCSNCNLGLGLFKDSVENLFKAQNYLEKQKTKLVICE